MDFACYDLRDVGADLQADEPSNEAAAADQEAFARGGSAFEERQRDLTIYFHSEEAIGLTRRVLVKELSAVG